MKFIYKDAPFPHILIEDFYTEEESILVRNELVALSNVLKKPEFTGSAAYQDGILKKQNLGIFISDVYNLPMVSPIFSVSRKLFASKEIDEVLSKNFVFKYFRMTDYDSTLVQFYKNGDYYKPHFDKVIYSLTTVFWIDQKKYTGGKLVFNEFDYELDLQHNSSIFFPSCVQHEVTEIKTDSDNLLDSRISITTFVGMNLFRVSNNEQAK